MKKRVLSAFMALALCLTLLPTAAWAEEADAPEGGAPTVSEQAGTNEDENGAEGGPQNTGTPDAGSTEESKADAPESGEDENAGNNADAQSGVHTHCVCGGNGDVNGHKHDTAGTEWTTTDSLPTSAGNYYLTRSVSGDWTVPTGEVNLCLNGQTINGKITVGSGATLTLTDCTGTGKLQGSGSGSGVSINGGTFNLYGGTITGFVNGVEIGSHNNIQTGSSFTMYGGAITGNKADSSGGGGVFLIGTTNSVVTAPSFTMHGGTISNNTAGASDGGGGGVYVGEKCSFTMDGGTITGNTATNGNGGGIYIRMLSSVTISGGEITNNKAPAKNSTSYGHGGGIYSESGVTVKNVTITGNNSNFEGGGIYGKGTIALTDATVTDNNHYDVYYDGAEKTTPKLTVSGSVQAGYYANFEWKLPILVSGALREDSVIRVGVREGINLGAIAEPASGVTLRAENFKADAADCVTSLGKDGKVYLVPCTHEMDDTGYTCKKCHTQFDARIGESAYYKTLTEAFNAVGDSTVTLLRDVTLTGNCSATDFKTLDLNGKTVSTKNKYIGVGGGNKPNTLTVKDSGTGGGTQALDVTFYVSSNGTLAVDNSYTGKISRVELQAGGTLERFGGEIGELVLSNAAYGSTSTGYGLKLWNGNTNACTIGKFTDNTTSKSLTVKDLLGTDYAKCELYGEKGGAWSIVDKSTKIVDLTGYTAYKVQFPECVHQCADDSNPVCSVCHKNLYTKITAKAADGTTKTAYFTEDSALENGYVEAIQTLNGWSNEGCTEPTLTLLRDMPYDTSITLTGTLTLEGGTHTASNVTVAENANVTFASGSYRGATIDGTATVETGVTFTDASVTVNGTLNAKGGTFDGRVEFNGSSIANISGGSFNCEKKYGGVTFDYNVTGTISGGTFVFADFYTTKVKLSGGIFTIIKTNGDRKLADLLAEGAAYYGASDNQAVTNDGVNTLENVKVVSHTHNGGTDGKGICSICGKQMAAALTVGGTTSWYAAFATAIEAANASDGEKTITLYQDVNGYVNGWSTIYELTRGPVTLATGGKTVTRANLTAKDISLTVTGSNGGFNVTVDGKGAELTVNDGNTKLAFVTAQNGGKLSLRNGTFSGVTVKDDGSSASLSGGRYGEIEGSTGYVKPYALLAKGYAYKSTKDSKWVSNANITLSKVTVEKAPFAVEKIYPNNDTNYTGSSAFATDGKITLTAVIAPGTENVSYQWQLLRESDKDWLSSQYFYTVNNAKHTGADSKTLSISNLPENSSYQYRVHVWSDNGYQCDSEPFTVTRHQHSWTYTASGATITAKCSKCSASGGSVTIKAPDELTYSGESKPATVTASSDWQGPAARDISIGYSKMGTYGQQILENGALPTDAGEYTASITVGEGENAKTASVKYTIQRADPKASDFTFTAPAGLTYDGNAKTATVTEKIGVTGMGDVTVKYYQGDKPVEKPTNAGDYTVKISVEEGTNYNAVADLTVGTLVINKINYPGANTAADTVRSGQATTDKTLTLPELPDSASYGTPAVGGTTPELISAQSVSGTTLTYSTTGQANNTSATITIPVAGATNYNDYSIVVTVTAKDKEDAGVSITTPPTSKTYGEADFTLTATKTAPDSGTWSWVSSDDTILEIVSDAATATPTIKVKKADATGATLTVTYTSSTHYGSANVIITVAQKEVTVSGITAADKVYDGNNSATVNASTATITGKVDGDDLTVSVAAGSTFDSADAGSRTVTLGTLTLGGTSAGNYTLATAGNQTEAAANITARDLTVKPNSGQSKSYGTTPDPVLAYTSTGTVTGETAAFDGALSREAGEDVGQYDITKGSLELKDSGTFKATNYNLVLDTAVVTFEITKGTYGGSAPTKTVNILKNYAGVQTGRLTAADFFTTAPAEAKITNAVPNFASSNMMSIAGADSSGNFTYDSKTNITAASDESWTITISSKNYTDITATLTFSPVDKTDVSAQITFPNGTLTYNGAGQTYEKATTSTTAAGTPAWTYTYAPADATASLDSAGLPKTAGTYTVTAKYEDDANIGTKNATLTINKATPTGEPKYTKITTSGKTLADAGLTVTGSTLNPNAGTLKWVDDAGAVLPDTTIVAANTSYKWLYTPADTANYNTLTGSIELYHKSSSGGGGGSYSPSYSITVDKTENGTITVSPKSASKGDTVTITVKPDKGYELDTLKVLDKDGDKVKITEKKGKYTFTMPASKVTVKVKFVEEAPEQIFADVPVDAYCYEAVKWAASEGITGGVGNNLFAPGRPCTRSQIVTFLWRAAGSPAPKSMSSFADVPADAYYAKAVAWAVENGITGGTGDGKFSPDATCTRAQAVTFLYRASGAPAVSGNAAFSDVATNAYYAAAVKWAEKNGITGGIGGGLFGSGNNCTRAQIVTFLYRTYRGK
ncbi:S-layer homology domain-containing protein [Agathobaculum sp.]|uniref:S-layer homology domain-containing protein n=1 Tax=Agathobaculum sp. TaxID=2048138 RepID=UPI003AB1FB15